MIDDAQAYLDYAKIRHLYNKLWLSEELGYYCGPAGLAPDRSGFYIVRPIMNLRGMSAGTHKLWLDAGDTRKVPPGYFWCEFFEGRHLSVTYEKVNSDYSIKHCYEGFKDENGKFIQWKKVSDELDLPKKIKKELCKQVKICNAEFIGGKLIEIHLRGTPDPESEELFPVWKDNQIIVDKLTKLGYNYTDSYDDADGFLDNPRLGFMIK
jgi:hypothetical protein